MDSRIYIDGGADVGQVESKGIGSCDITMVVISRPARSDANDPRSQFIEVQFEINPLRSDESTTTVQRLEATAYKDKSHFDR